MKDFMRRIEDLMEIGGVKKNIVFLVISGTVLFLSVTGLIRLPFNIAWIAIVLCGFPIIMEAIIGLTTEFDIKADVLVSLALIAAICIGEVFAAGEIAFIMQLGALLEDLTVAKAREGIEKLVKLTPKTSRIIKNGEESIVESEMVKEGDVIRVLPGESIPVDGIIISGVTSIDQAVMTGESLPVDKTVGDEVASGTINQFGAFEMRATKVGEDSSIQRMIKLVQSADAGKSKIVGIADRWATWIVIIALSAALLTWMFTGEITRAVTILVVFCPCALVLATPTAIMAAIGNATKHGFLVREGDALERLSRVDTIAFDKTGTLTYGKLEVTKYKSIVNDFSDEDIFMFAAASETLSEHPIGKAVLASYKEKIKNELPQCEDFIMMVGRGVSATVNNKKILAGNIKLLDTNNISVENTDEITKYSNQGSTVIYISIDNRFVGYIVLSDTLRAESGIMVSQLNKLGVFPVLLTGDNSNAADSIASLLNISEHRAECMPEDKLKFIENRENLKKPVCMIGDGINDAPALKRSTVGIAMGGVGSDIAIEAADIALVDDDVKELPHLLSLSKKMMNTIKLNMSFSMGLNFIAIFLAITGVLNPIVGALVHNAGSVLVIINSSLLLKWKGYI
ncbi:cadmium-translocating P-type ATPase [Lachnoanaerobaculum gingivalis]|jgi:cadmium-exporting ATPase|uniref:Cd(2+)-exporting ATPase n=1 Tax=Lachnoanaerobaculum gingivalis TaxID=2490855 RepID=A0A3P3QXL9_9FIRM|nr:cation-translocating P-type ATPase [Lachnoanaerobaculum gingivalis]RRJ25478.1 cadmium-translocating P-type ATPase [Lachnoanaerobaculum gingivalis]